MMRPASPAGEWPGDVVNGVGQHLAVQATGSMTSGRSLVYELASDETSRASISSEGYGLSTSASSAGSFARVQPEGFTLPRQNRRHTVVDQPQKIDCLGRCDRAGGDDLVTGVPPCLPEPARAERLLLTALRPAWAGRRNPTSATRRTHGWAQRICDVSVQCERRP